MRDLNANAVLAAYDVTDEQLRDLHQRMLGRVERSVDTREDRLALLSAGKALGKFVGITDAERATARIRCAEILSAQGST